MNQAFEGSFYELLNHYTQTAILYYNMNICNCRKEYKLEKDYRIFEKQSRKYKAIVVCQLEFYKTHKDTCCQKKHK